MVVRDPKEIQAAIEREQRQPTIDKPDTKLGKILRVALLVIAALVGVAVVVGAVVRGR
jgi:hypothetical protein